MGSYYVEPDNWTSNIPSTFTSDKGEYSFDINIDHVADPAEGCLKEFTATYKCGNNDSPVKTLRVAKDATGKKAKFNCKTEYALCSSLKLALGDDGYLTLKDSSGKVLWTNSSDTGLTIPDSIPVIEYKATLGKNGRNYLKSGEFLNAGEWIGSTTGKYRLLMDGTDKQLKVVYNQLQCGETTGPNDNTAASIYAITPDPMRGNLGKLGYVDNTGLLKLYPDTMTGFSSNYTSVGGYNVIGSNLEGPKPITTVTNIVDEVACQNLCNEHNNETTNLNSDKCAGVVFDRSHKLCQLKDNTVFQTGKRIINNNYEYYLRSKSVAGTVDATCPSNVADYVFSNTTDWGKMTLASTGMTPTTKCGLANYVQAERGAADSSNNALIGNVIQQGGIKANISTMSATYSTLQQKLNTAKTSLKTMFNELMGTRKDLSDWTGEQLTQLEAMNEDRDLNMLSQNYKHIMWSILAIIIIMATIKMTKTAASSTVSSAASSAASSAMSSILPKS
jgi:hypothetical protein